MTQAGQARGYRPSKIERHPPLTYKYDTIDSDDPLLIIKLNSIQQLLPKKNKERTNFLRFPLVYLHCPSLSEFLLSPASTFFLRSETEKHLKEWSPS